MFGSILMFLFVGILCAEKETESDNFSPCVPSHKHGSLHVGFH